MDDNTALERQIGVVLGRMGGPEPTFDAMAVTRAAATHAPKWRFQSMFSATKFVLAGVIVALFGGILLAGLLVAPRSKDMAPAAMSPSPMTTDELLSGMVTEEVGPGVYRVLDDGAGHDLVSDAPLSVAIAPDDSVWLLGRSLDPELPLDIGYEGRLVTDTLFELGQVGTHALGTGEGDTWTQNGAWTRLAVDEEGIVWVPDGSSTRSFDGTSWRNEAPVPRPPEVSERLGGRPRPPDGAGSPVEAPPGGSLRWGTASEGPDGTSWAYLTVDMSRTESVPNDAYLARFDGDTWDVFPVPTDYDDVSVGLRVTVDGAGAAWMWFEGHAWPLDLPEPLGRSRVPPGVLSFAGQTWHQYLEGFFVHDVDIASDGTVFATVRYGCDSDHAGKGASRRQCQDVADPTRAGLYIITPEAVAATE